MYCTFIWASCLGHCNNDIIIILIMISLNQVWTSIYVPVIGNSDGSRRTVIVLFCFVTLMLVVAIAVVVITGVLFWKRRKGQKGCFSLTTVSKLCLL